MLALQNNYDIAIQRLNLDIADTDILRTQVGGASPGHQHLAGDQHAGQQRIGGDLRRRSGRQQRGGNGRGRHCRFHERGRTCAGESGSHVQGTIQLQRQQTPQNNLLFSGGKPSLTTNTDEYNFTYNQGFRTGTGLQVAFRNRASRTDSPFNTYQPALTTTFNAQITQHLLQGFGWGLNSRFIVQATNDRRIADSVFRSQLLYTINQVEDIYWGLVSAYEDVQSKQRALDQSTNLEKDDEKQLQIGSMAPLDVVNAKSQMSSDQQALIASQSNLEYQQLLMKQAIARNLDDPRLANAPVIPTDRVSLAETPEERMSGGRSGARGGGQQPRHRAGHPESEERRDHAEGREKRAAAHARCLRVLWGAGPGRSAEPELRGLLLRHGLPTTAGSYPTVGYGTVVANLFNSSGAEQGCGLHAEYSDPQPPGAGTPGAVADRVSPGGDAAAAALRADSDAGHQRPVRADQRPGLGECR